MGNLEVALQGISGDFNISILPKYRGALLGRPRSWGNSRWPCSPDSTPLQQGLYDVVPGGGDVAEERRDGCDGMGGERSGVVDIIERGRAASVPRRPRLAVAAQSRLLPPRLHVHHLLRIPHLRRLRSARTSQSISSRGQSLAAVSVAYSNVGAINFSQPCY